MKLHAIPLPVCLLAGLLVLVHPLGAGTQTVEPGLTVHEWGTFTSIAGNDGHAMEWAPLTGAWPGSDLPGFVEHFGIRRFKLRLRGAIRMETPVIYFYSPRDLNLSVHVAFSKGLITEWYPHASRVSPTQEVSTTSLYKNGADGTISWSQIHLEAGTNPEFPREEAKHSYYEARQTSAAPLSIRTAKGEQHEKFLFYRGVSSFTLPISAQLATDGNLLVNNLVNQEIPSLILFERRGDRIGYRISTGLDTKTTIQPPELTRNINTLYRDLEEILVARGLYRDEAQAMIRTWQTSWFEEGSRLFYIVPRSFVDAILPLTINPQPGNTVRVFVGRMELVTSATQNAVLQALASHDRKTLQMYNRFMDPILRAIAGDDPAKENYIQQLMRSAHE